MIGIDVVNCICFEMEGMIGFFVNLFVLCVWL